GGGRGGVGWGGVTLAAAAGVLQREAPAGLHLVPPGGWRCVSPRSPQPDQEAGPASGVPARHSGGWEAALVIAANHGRVFQEFVFAQQAQTAPPSTRAAAIGNQFEDGDAAREL